MGFVEEVGAEDAVLVRKFVVQSSGEEISDTACCPAKLYCAVSHLRRPDRWADGKKVDTSGRQDRLAR